MAVLGAPKSLKLYYFDLTGRAEATRIMLSWAGLQFEDITIARDQWPEYKKQMPFGQVPVLEVDGHKLCQTSAIERYVAGLSGLIPNDPFQAAKVDELVALFHEMQDLFSSTYSIKDQDARVKARQDIVAGPLKAKLDKLSELVAPEGQYFLGDKLTYADFVAYDRLSFLCSGFLDGVPTNLLDDYPALKAHHNRVASLPAVAQRYEAVSSGPRLSYKVMA